MIRSLILVLALLGPLWLSAQSESHEHQEPDFVCGSMFYEQELQKHPEHRLAYPDGHEQQGQPQQSVAPAPSSYSGARSSNTVSVVIHIVHDMFGNGDIPNAQARDAIDHLNETFANTGVYDQGSGVNTNIQFCLAQQDPMGNFTTGITRTVSPLTNVSYGLAGDYALKSLIGWNQSLYLNIYVVNGFIGGPSGLAGYAYLPSSHGLYYDGIVMKSQYMGSSADNSKVLAHEAGHYLGLYHTFQNGCSNTNCLTSGDKVCDTPPDATNFPSLCSGGTNSCTTDVNLSDPNNPFTADQNDLSTNYMDYTWLTCMHDFTAGQSDRMVAVLTGTTTAATFPDADVSWDRSSLLSSSACDNLCPNPIAISFTPMGSTVNIGTTITFNNTSSISGSNNYSYTWKADDVAFSTSGSSASYTFSSLGTTEICFVANNVDPWCPDSICTTVEVVCPVNATVTADATVINPGDDVNFTSTATGTGTLTTQWYLDGVAITQPSSFLYNFPTGGTYLVQYVVSNGLCGDTAAVIIQVGNCLNKRRNTWHFGKYAAIDFNGSSPVTATSNLDMDEVEGCSSISDANGNLVFYTDGVKAWNPSGLIPGATNMGAFGYPATFATPSTQDALIVPKPGSASEYYVFTNEPILKQLSYAVIDMAMNGGLGGVATPKTLLSPHTFEKVTAVNHCDGQSVWIISEDENYVFSFLLSTTGLSTTAVTSPTTGDPLFDYYGQLKASPDGRYLASARRSSFGIKLYRFNNTTGTASFIVDIPTGDGYGVAWSTDGTKLYCKPLINDNLYQIDVSNPAPAAILSSVTMIATLPTPAQSRRQMQVGPDERIYITHKGSPNLITVENPNAAAGSVVVNNTGFTLTSNQSISGLPNLNQSYYYDFTPAIVGPNNMCEYTSGHIYSLPTTCATGETVVWSILGNGIIFSSTNAQANVTVTDDGTAQLIAEKTTACGVVRSDTFDITIVDASTGNCPYDTCSISGDFVATVNSDCSISFTNTSTGSTQISWFWNFGDGVGTSTSANPVYTYGAAGTYNVCLVVTASNGLSTCSDSVCVTVVVNCTPPCGGKSDFSYNINGCTVDFTSLPTPNPGNSANSYNWTFGDANSSSLANPTHTYSSPGTYQVCLITTFDNGIGKCEDTTCYTIQVACTGCELTASFYYKMKDNCTANFTDFSSVPPGFTITNWDWTFGDGFSSTLQNPGHTYSGNGPFTVCLTITAVATDGTICTKTTCKTITLSGCESFPPCKLKVGFNYKSINECSKQFYGSVNPGVGVTVTGWLWNFGDGTTSTLQNPVHNFPSSGTYNVCVTVYAHNGFVGCYKTFCKAVTILGCISKPCGVKVGFTNVNVGSCTVAFTDVSNPASTSTITGWLWEFGDGTTSTLQNPVHTYGYYSAFNVCLTVYASNGSKGCYKKVCKTVYPKGCSFIAIGPKRLAVSPNPSAGQFRLELEGETIQREQVLVYNSFGQLVTFGWTGNGIAPQIDLSGLASGFYWVTVEHSGELFRQKLVLRQGN